MDNVVAIGHTKQHLSDHVVAAFEAWKAKAPKDGLLDLEDLGAMAGERVPTEDRVTALRRALGNFASTVLHEKRAQERHGKPFDLAELIVRTEFSYAGVLGDPAEMDAQDIEMTADDVLAQIPATEILAALKQAIQLAVPAVLAERHKADRS